jgi:CheY-like chemotaxis protein
MRGSGDVLIVDDEPDMADVIRAVLESEGYSCRVVNNGEKAIAEVAFDMPGVVLLDVLMPVMNGIECSRALRQAYGGALPIVIMTAAEHVESRREEAQADAVISKPFELQELISVIARFLAPRREREAVTPATGQ